MTTTATTKDILERQDEIYLKNSLHGAHGIIVVKIRCALCHCEG